MRSKTWILIIFLFLIVVQVEFYMSWESQQDYNDLTAWNTDIIQAISRGANFTESWDRYNGQKFTAVIFQSQDSGGLYGTENNNWAINISVPTREWVNITWAYFTFERIDITHDIYGWSDDVGRWVRCEFYVY